MNVKSTGRQYEITPAVRTEVETGLAKIRKILGDRFEAKAVLAVEKHRHKAEITITPRNGPLVGLAQAKDMMIAVGQALDHLEKQAVKYKTRWQSKKRKSGMALRSRNLRRPRKLGSRRKLLSRSPCTAFRRWPKSRTCI